MKIVYCKNIKKAQIYVTDYIIALLVAILFISVYFFYSADVDTYENYMSDFINTEAESISYSLISEGIPNDWNKYNVILPGLLNNERSLDDSKVFSFFNMSYLTQKELLKIINEFKIYVQDDKGNIISFENGTIKRDAAGYYQENISDATAKIQRFIEYNNTYATLNILVWKKKS